MRSLQLGSPVSSPSHEQVCRSRILALAMSAPRPRLAAARGAEIGGVAASRKRGRAPVHDGAVAAGRGWPSRDAHAGEPEGVGGGAAGGPPAFMPLPPMDDQDEDTGGAESRRESAGAGPRRPMSRMRRPRGTRGHFAFGRPARACCSNSDHDSMAELEAPRAPTMRARRRPPALI